MTAGTRARLAADSLPHHQIKSETSTDGLGHHRSAPASETLNQPPKTVSKEYHQASPEILTADSESEKHAEEDRHSIPDVTEEDLEANHALQIQEADQHDYENAIAIDTPTEQQEDMYTEQGIKFSLLGPSASLLAPIKEELAGRKCLVLDLDETLVHSSFRYVRRADFIIPVQIDSQNHNVYVIKRPGVDEFMRRVGELFEVVVFTASVSKYGDPLLDQLDIHNVVHHRLFRESCYNHNGNFVKNLAVLGRPLQDTIIIDNSPTSYIFHPQHAVPVSSWFFDAHDNELLDMIPFLEDLASSKVPDVSMVLNMNLDES